MYDIKANATMSKMPIRLSSVSDAEISAKPPSITPNRHNTHTQAFTNVAVFIISPLNVFLVFSLVFLLGILSCRSSAE